MELKLVTITQNVDKRTLLLRNCSTRLDDEITVRDRQKVNMTLNTHNYLFQTFCCVIIDLKTSREFLHT